MIFVPVPEEANYDINKISKGLSPRRSADSAAIISVRHGQPSVRRFRRNIVLADFHGDAIRYDLLSLGSSERRR